MTKEKSWMVKNNIQANITWNAETEQTLLTLQLSTESQTNVTRFMSIRLMKQENFCGVITLNYFFENCLKISHLVSKNKSIYLWQNVGTFC